jgi:hypothetical protein
MLVTVPELRNIGIEIDLTPLDMLVKNLQDKGEVTFDAQYDDTDARLKVGDHVKITTAGWNVEAIVDSITITPVVDGEEDQVEATMRPISMKEETHEQRPGQDTDSDEGAKLDGDPSRAGNQTPPSRSHLGRVQHPERGRREDAPAQGRRHRTRRRG